MSTETESQPLTNLCGDVTGSVNLEDNTYHIDKGRTGFYKNKSGVRIFRCWITTPENYKELKEALRNKDAIYVCPRIEDAVDVAKYLNHSNYQYNVYLPEFDHKWQSWAAEHRINFVHTSTEKLKNKYSKGLSHKEAMEKLFLEDDTLACEGGVYIAPSETTAQYQNYLLGGSLKPISEKVLGTESTFLRTHFPEFCEKIESLQTSADEVAAYETLNKSVDAELKDHISFKDEFPKASFSDITKKDRGVFITNATEGAGKTQKVSEAIADLDGYILAVTNTVSLTNELAKRLNCTSYQDIGTIVNGDHLGRVACCLNSLINPVILSYVDTLECVFFDECLAILDSLALGTHITESNRIFIYETIVSILKSTPKVIISDANLNQAALDFLKACRDDIYLLEFEYKVREKPNVVLYDSKESLLKTIVEKAQTSSKCITVFTDSKAMSNTLEIALSTRVLGLKRTEIALLNSENKGGDEFRKYDTDFWNHISGNLKPFKFLVASPVIGSGVSLDENVDENTFCVFTGILDIPSNLQQASRNRLTKTLHVYYCEDAIRKRWSENGNLLSRILKVPEEFNIKDPLDLYMVSRKATEESIKGRKIEFLMRALEFKGYSLSWEDSEEGLNIKKSFSKFSKKAKKERLEAIKGASNLILMDDLYRTSVLKKQARTQAESDEVHRLDLADLYLENPDIKTGEKLDAFSTAVEILKNLEILRMSLPEVKGLEKSEIALNCKKTPFVKKRDFLLILNRASHPSQRICKNILKELLKDIRGFQRVSGSSMGYWAKNMESLNHVRIVGKLCKEFLGFELKRSDKKVIVLRGFDLLEVDNRRMSNGVSMFAEDALKYKHLSKFFESVFEKPPHPLDNSSETLTGQTREFDLVSI